MEYCHCTVDGVELDEYLTREDIHRIICTKCGDYEHSDKNVFHYCEEHETTPEESAREQERVRRKLAMPFNHEKKKRVRSDGKPDIEYKYRQCLTKSERRARKIDRKHNRS